MDPDGLAGKTEKLKVDDRLLKSRGAHGSEEHESDCGKSKDKRPASFVQSGRNLLQKSSCCLYSVVQLM